MQLEWLIATSRAGVSWILAKVTKYDLEREFHNYNEVSCDVECCNRALEVNYHKS